MDDQQLRNQLHMVKLYASEAAAYFREGPDDDQHVWFYLLLAEMYRLQPPQGDPP